MSGRNWRTSIGVAVTSLGVVAASANASSGEIGPGTDDRAVASTSWRIPVKLAPASPSVLGHDVALSTGVAAVAWVTRKGLRVRVRVPQVGWRRTVGLDGSGSERPSISANDRGDLAAAWTKVGPRRTTLRVSRRPAGGQWSRPKTLAKGFPGFESGADVSTGPLGKVTVALSNSRRGEPTSRTRVFSFIDGRWGRPASFGGGYAHNVRVVTGPEGHVTAAWLTAAGRRCVANGSGRSWTRTRCWEKPRAFDHLELAVDDTGRVYLMIYNRVWSRAPGSRWRREPVPFGNNAAFPEGPTFSIDASSSQRAVVAWSDGDLTGRDRIDWKTFASVRGSDGNWTRRVRLSKFPDPSAAITRGGTAYVAWTGRLGVRVARRPVGLPWSNPPAVVGKAPSEVPRIVVNRGGDALLAFQRFFSRSSLWAAWRP